MHTILVCYYCIMFKTCFTVLKLFTVLFIKKKCTFGEHYRLLNVYLYKYLPCYSLFLCSNLRYPRPYDHLDNGLVMLTTHILLFMLCSNVITSHVCTLHRALVSSVVWSLIWRWWATSLKEPRFCLSYSAQVCIWLHRCIFFTLQFISQHLW